ncbi:MAG: MATE family efflux transporter [Oscillospiraceae bacterium]
MKTNSHIFKTFFKYVSFSVLSMIGLSLYILADTFFVANGIGSDGLAALNLVIPMYSLINAVGLMIGMGAATRFSILKGGNNEQKGNEVFTQSVIIGIIVGAIFTVVGLLFSGNIAKLFGADAETLPFADSYLKTLMSFSIFFISSNILICFVRNDKNPNLAMTAMLSGCIANIFLDYIFIFPCGMGMFGAALATGFAPLIGIIISSFHFAKKKNSFKFVKCKFSGEECKKTFSLGTSAFINEISNGLLVLVFNFVFLKIAGNIAVAAYGVIANLAIVCVSIFTGIGQGIQPVISLNYGLGKAKDIKKYYLLALITATIFGVIFFLTAVFFPDEIIGIFNKENDLQLTEIARNGILIYFSSFLIMGVNIITTTYFSSIAKPKEAFIISILRGCSLSIILVLILPKIFGGINGVWATVPLTELLTLFVCLAFVFKFRKISSPK